MIRRACLVGPAYPYRGGISHSTSLLGHEFAKDHDVTVVNFKRLYPSFLFPGKTQYDESKTAFSIESKRVIDTMNPATFWRAAKEISRSEPDIIVFQWWHPFFAIAYAPIMFLLGRIDRDCVSRIVLICHNVLPHESSPIDRALIRSVFARANAFLVHSAEDRENLLKMRRGARVEINPLPIFDLFPRGRYTRSAARSALGVDGPVVLFFGLVRPYKGLSVLLDALARTAGKLDAKLLVVGEFYESKDKYAALIRRLGIDDKVIVVDRYVPNEEVELYFAASDVVALPYLSATQSAIVQVAYAFERPVIVTAVGGLPEVVEHGVTGYVVPPNDPAALSGAIIRFFEEGRGDEMGRNIRGSADRFSWRRCKDALVRLAEPRAA